MKVSANAKQPTLVAVDGVLCDLTRTIAGSTAMVRCLIPPGGDPHQYKLRPSDRKAISNADLVLYNGFYLTPAAKKISGPKNIIAVAEEAMPDYSGGDPHVWHNPANSAAMITVIAEKLTPLISINERNSLANRLENAKTILTKLDRWGSKQFATIPEPQRILASAHKAYGHLTERYGMKQLTMLDSYSTGGVLRPSSLSKITSAVTSSGVKTLFPESIPASKTMRRISRSTGVPIYSKQLFPDGLAPQKTTIGTFASNVCTVVIGQGGRCDKNVATELDNRWSSIR